MTRTFSKRFPTNGDSKSHRFSIYEPRLVLEIEALIGRCTPNGLRCANKNGERIQETHYYVTFKNEKRRCWLSATSLIQAGLSEKMRLFDLNYPLEKVGQGFVLNDIATKPQTTQRNL